jgi:hypothetical protein
LGIRAGFDLVRRLLQSAPIESQINEPSIRPSNRRDDGLCTQICRNTCMCLLPSIVRVMVRDIVFVVCRCPTPLQLRTAGQCSLIRNVLKPMGHVLELDRDAFIQRFKVEPEKCEALLGKDMAKSGVPAHRVNGEKYQAYKVSTLHMQRTPFGWQSRVRFRIGGPKIAFLGCHQCPVQNSRQIPCRRMPGRITCDDSIRVILAFCSQIGIGLPGDYFGKETNLAVGAACAMGFSSHSMRQVCQSPKIHVDRLIESSRTPNRCIIALAPFGLIQLHACASDDLGLGWRAGCLQALFPFGVVHECGERLDDQRYCER